MADEQFGKFIEVIKKLYVNIPLLDAMQVPMYLAYPRLVSRSIKLVRLSIDLRYSLPQCFPEDKIRYPGIVQGEVLQR